MKHRLGLATVLAVAMIVAVVPAASARSGGEARPFGGTATGIVHWNTNPLDCAGGATTASEATMLASHLGKGELWMWHCPADFEAGITDGVFVLVAANGDELHGTYTGPIFWLDESSVLIGSTSSLVIDGGTGRFDDAHGAATMQVVTGGVGWEAPEWPYEATFSGSISY